MYWLAATVGDPQFDLFGQQERALQRLSDESHNRSTPSGPRQPLEPGGGGEPAAPE
jgi:hypothetical protein